MSSWIIKSLLIWFTNVLSPSGGRMLTCCFKAVLTLLYILQRLWGKKKKQQTKNIQLIIDLSLVYRHFSIYSPDIKSHSSVVFRVTFIKRWSFFTISLLMQYCWFKMDCIFLLAAAEWFFQKSYLFQPRNLQFYNCYSIKYLFEVSNFWQHFIFITGNEKSLVRNLVPCCLKCAMWVWVHTFCYLLVSKGFTYLEV